MERIRKVKGIMEEEQDRFIDANDFASLKDLRIKTAFITTQTEKAMLEQRIAELEYKTAVLNVYIKNRMSLSETIDDNTGKIIKKEKKEEK